MGQSILKGSVALGSAFLRLRFETEKMYDSLARDKNLWMETEIGGSKTPRTSPEGHWV